MENANNMEVNVEHYVILSWLGQLGIDIVSNFLTAGWNNFFRGNVMVYPELIRLFWKTINFFEQEIRGTIPGKEIIVSEATISAATGYVSEGVCFTSNWKLNYEDDVSKVLFVNPTHQGRLIA